MEEKRKSIELIATWILYIQYNLWKHHNWTEQEKKIKIKSEC